MLRFFRTIRKKLIEQDNIRKYLLYAIGEILLVVIGILIALQVNTWNQNRTDRNKSADYHQRLVDDLEFILSTTDGYRNKSEEIMQSLNHSVLLLQKGELTESGKDTLDYALSYFFQFVRISGELNSYEEMKSTGQLGLIYNPELRDSINEYLAYLEAISKIFDQLAEKVNDTSVIDKYVTVIPAATPAGTTFLYDFKEMAADQELINILSRYANNWQTRTVFTSQLHSLTEELKIEIEQELERL